jgi:hypothetical protein
MISVSSLLLADFVAEIGDHDSEAADAIFWGARCRMLHWEPALT